MSEPVSYQLDDGVATLTLCNGKVNAISHEVITGLNAALDRATEDKAVVIITGQPGILSGGYDLKVMTSSVENAIALVTVGSMLARRTPSAGPLMSTAGPCALLLQKVQSAGPLGTTPATAIVRGRHAGATTSCTICPAAQTRITPAS